MLWRARHHSFFSPLGSFDSVPYSPRTQVPAPASLPGMLSLPLVPRKQSTLARRREGVPGLGSVLVTPAMETELTDHIWSLGELLA